MSRMPTQPMPAFEWAINRAMAPEAIRNIDPDIHIKLTFSLHPKEMITDKCKHNDMMAVFISPIVRWISNAQANIAGVAQDKETLCIS